MSRDLQDAVNNFALGWNLTDKMIARRDAAEAARQKWQIIAQMRAEDRAEKARRNAIYEKQVEAHNKLYEAQAGYWARKQPGGGGVKIGGGDIYSPAGKQFIDEQAARGSPVGGGGGQTSSPSITLDIPEPPPVRPPAPVAPSDSDTMPFDLAVNEAEGGIVPRTLPLSSLGVGGTSGPGSGFGVRASPPSYAEGGNVKKKFQWGPWYDPLRYAPGVGQPSRAPVVPDVSNTAAGSYQDPTDLYRTPGPSNPQEPGAPAQGSNDPDNSSYGAAVSRVDEDIHPPFPTTGAKPGAIRTAARPWAPATDTYKGLRDQTRVAAYDPVKDRLDPYNRHYVTDDYRVAPWAQQDWAARWNNQNIFGNPGGGTAPGSGSVFNQGGAVRYDGGGDVLHGILGTAGWAAGHLVPFVGPPVGQFVGHTAANVIEGKTGDIGSDAAHDFTQPIPFLGGQLGDAIGGKRDVGPGDQIESTVKNPLGMLGGLGGGGGDAGGWASPSDMGGALDMGDSGFTFAAGGYARPVPNYERPKVEDRRQEWDRYEKGQIPDEELDQWEERDRMEDGRINEERYQGREIDPFDRSEDPRTLKFRRGGRARRR